MFLELAHMLQVFAGGVALFGILMAYVIFVQPTGPGTRSATGQVTPRDVLGGTAVGAGLLAMASLGLQALPGAPGTDAEVAGVVVGNSAEIAEPTVVHAKLMAFELARGSALLSGLADVRPALPVPELDAARDAANALKRGLDLQDVDRQDVAVPPSTTVPPTVPPTVPTTVAPSTTTSTTTTTTTTTSTTTTTVAPTTTTTTTTTTTVAPTTTTTTTTVAPRPVAPSCHPSYVGNCVPYGVSDVDCAGGSGNGPYYTGRVQVVGHDEYDLDRDGDGVGCQNS